jgi:hypothetical protein
MHDFEPGGTYMERPGYEHPDFYGEVFACLHAKT